MNRYFKWLFAGVCSAAAAFGMLSFNASADAASSEAVVETEAAEIGIVEEHVSDTENPTTGTAAGLAMIAVMGGAVIASKRKSK